jgi:hypothetical protein
MPFFFRESAMDAPKAFEIATIKKIAWRILPLILSPIASLMSIARTLPWRR